MFDSSMCECMRGAITVGCAVMQTLKRCFVTLVFVSSANVRFHLILHTLRESI